MLPIGFPSHGVTLLPLLQVPRAHGSLILEVRHHHKSLSSQRNQLPRWRGVSRGGAASETPAAEVEKPSTRKQKSQTAKLRQTQEEEVHSTSNQNSSNVAIDIIQRGRAAAKEEVDGGQESLGETAFGKVTSSPLEVTLLSSTAAYSAFVNTVSTCLCALGCFNAYATRGQPHLAALVKTAKMLAKQADDVVDELNKAKSANDGRVQGTSMSAEDILNALPPPGLPSYTSMGMVAVGLGLRLLFTIAIRESTVLRRWLTTIPAFPLSDADRVLVKLAREVRRSSRVATSGFINVLH